MQHFFKASWDEDCTLLNTCGHTVIPNFLEYTHIIWLARWIFRASLQIAFARACTLHRASQNAVFLLLWKKKPAIFVTLQTCKTCESPIPLRHHTRCDWRKAGRHFMATGIQLADSMLTHLLDVASLGSDSTISNRVPNTCR